VLVGGAIITALLLAGGSAAWIITRNDSVYAPSSSALPTHSLAYGPATLDASRVVEVNGSVVTVRETTSIVEGGPITIAPSKKLPAAGLTVTRTVVAGEDGSNQPFTSPTTLMPGRSITIEGQYRLNNCPDLLPAEWPIPVTVVPGNWSRTFSRVDEPQRTAHALCPRTRSSAKQLRILRGSMVQGKGRVLRLQWLGTQELTVRVIGSASGVAAVGSGGRCAGGCVAELKPDSSVRVRLRPLEKCPVGGKTNWLTLGLVVGKGPMRTAGLNIAGLGQRVCG
jgi:hypothetical protein